MDIARVQVLRKGVRLEVVTIAWMVVEAVVALGAGILARSVLLTAFGVDSVIELLSGLVLYRRLAAEQGGAKVETAARLEVTATRISAVLLVLLCVYVVASSAAGLALRVMPSASIAGVVISAAAIVAMPLLARAKRRVNDFLDSPSLRADIAETVSCAYLAGVTLAGLALAMLTGWWWTQYVAALGLLVWLVPEARETLVEWRHNGANHGGRDER